MRSPSVITANLTISDAGTTTTLSPVLRGFLSVLTTCSTTTGSAGTALLLSMIAAASAAAISAAVSVAAHPSRATRSTSTTAWSATLGVRTGPTCPPPGTTPAVSPPIVVPDESGAVPETPTPPRIPTPCPSSLSATNSASRRSALCCSTFAPPSVT